MKGRQIRRKDDSDSDGNDEINIANVTRETLAAKKAEQTKRTSFSNKIIASASSQKKVSLSFGSDETEIGEDEAVVIKRSKASRMLSKTKLSVPIADESDPLDEMIKSAPNTYDSESLAALRSSQSYSVPKTVTQVLDYLFLSIQS